MSGKRIDDHKFFAGSGSPTFPKGNHVKMEKDGGSDGHLSNYEDTTESIKSQQDMQKKKAKSAPMKPGNRH